MSDNTLKSSSEEINLFPVKSFFVHMLTRDIALDDAIMDLLDNCIDGIIRSQSVSGERPYTEFYAHINLNENGFEISDNCGGIPWEKRHYAFKLGREDGDFDPNLPTIGTYGIGMKRALFKIGRNSIIQTHSGDNSYTVKIDESWINDKRNWVIPLTKGSEAEKGHTKISVSSLNPEVAQAFSSKCFLQDLSSKISSHYAFILEKGFSIFINGTQIKGRHARLIYDNKLKIEPYIYKDIIDGVEVFLAVGFTRSILSQEELDQDADQTKNRSSLDAGWTVVCNDRAVLYCNRDELTGWGEGGVPKYHTQFIAIAGIVEFRCPDARKLPMTTTKRGIDGNSKLYLQVKNQMRNGIRKFIEYTNKWKIDVETGKNNFSSASRAYSLPELRKMTDEHIILLNSNTRDSGEYLIPNLPLPERQKSDTIRIAYKVTKSAYSTVERFICDPDTDEKWLPSKIGEYCFNDFLERISK